MLRRSFYLTFFLISSTVFSFSGINSKDLPNFSSLAEYTSPSVVNVSVVKTVPSRDRMQGSRSPFPPGSPFEDFFNFPFEDRNQPERKIQSGGSGFIISSDGYVLTNHHVIEDASEITISLNDRREFKAKLIGSDKKADVAVLKIDSDKELPFLKLGNSDEVKVGDWVVAIGSPYRLNFSVTAGIVSAKTRSVPGRETSYIPFIQSDVAINPGNSGGPLFNMNGEVVGINAMIYSGSGGYMGISFTIPMNYAKEMVDQIIETGSVARGWLGVSVQEITKDLADSFELGTPRGALIGSVIKESPAERAGFKNGDVILEFDGKKIIYSGDLPLIVGRIKPDTKVDALVFRDKKEKIIPVKVGQLEELDHNQPVLAEKIKKRNKLEIVVGSIDEISSDDRERLNISSGVLVKEVYPGPASEAGIQIGDVITSIAQKEIKNTNDYRKIVSFLKKGSSVPIRIVRNGNGTFLTLKIEK
ncbi:MAG: DegQ family serine endoprotease [Gammaproteobacteria bacterium]